MQLPQAVAELSEQLRTARRLTNLYPILIGLLTLVSAYGFFRGDVSTSSALHDQLPDKAENLWNGTWAVTGVMMIFGALRPHRPIELLAHIFFAASLVPYCVAVFDKFGTSPGFFLGVIVLALEGLRMYFLVHFAGRIGLLDRSDQA